MKYVFILALLLLFLGNGRAELDTETMSDDELGAKELMQNLRDGKYVCGFFWKGGAIRLAFASEDDYDSFVRDASETASSISSSDSEDAAAIVIALRQTLDGILETINKKSAYTDAEAMVWASNIIMLLELKEIEDDDMNGLQHWQFDGDTVTISQRRK